jgi:hypothetical protein
VRRHRLDHRIEGARHRRPGQRRRAVKLEQVGAERRWWRGCARSGHARHRRRRPVDPRRDRPAPQAVICLDAFHVVAWATAALDAVRWGTWNQLRATSDTHRGHLDEKHPLRTAETHPTSPVTNAHPHPRRTLPTPPRPIMKPTTETAVGPKNCWRGGRDSATPPMPTALHAIIWPRGGTARPTAVGCPSTTLGSCVGHAGAVP